MWHFTNGKYLNWETTSARECSDEGYMSKYNLSKEVVDKGIYLQSLDNSRSLALQYNNQGVICRRLKNWKRAQNNYLKALEL